MTTTETTTAIDDVLAAFAAGTLELPAQRPDPVVARAPLADSESETVRRHAATYGPRAVVVKGAAKPIEPCQAPKTARRIGLDELGTARTKRVQLARLAEDHGWQWRATTALGPDGRESVVLRLQRVGSFPWDHDRAVAYWSGPRLPFVAAFAWRVYGGVLKPPRGVPMTPEDDPVEGEPVPPGWIVPVRLAAAELAEHLKSERCR